MDSTKVYHEKQSLLFCAKHALNNLYQNKLFTSNDLDNFCEELTKTKFLYNPHRNLFKLGNYDINVIEKALQFHGHTIQWFDMRKSVRDVKFVEEKDQIFGLILNVEYKNKLDKLFGCNTHHWLTIKLINNEIYNLDSKNDREQIMTEDELYAYLRYVQTHNGQILIVRKLQNENEFAVNNENEEQREIRDVREEPDIIDIKQQ